MPRESNQRRDKHVDADGAEHRDQTSRPDRQPRRPQPRRDVRARPGLSSLTRTSDSLPCARTHASATRPRLVPSRDPRRRPDKPPPSGEPSGKLGCWCRSRANDDQRQRRRHRCCVRQKAVARPRSSRALARDDYEQRRHATRAEARCSVDPAGVSIRRRAHARSGTMGTRLPRRGELARFREGASALGLPSHLRELAPRTLGPTARSPRPVGP